MTNVPANNEAFKQYKLGGIIFTIPVHQGEELENMHYENEDDERRLDQQAELELINSEF